MRTVEFYFTTAAVHNM